jgi:hypothetical protein
MTGVLLGINKLVTLIPHRIFYLLHTLQGHISTSLARGYITG